MLLNLLLERKFAGDALILLVPLDVLFIRESPRQSEVSVPDILASRVLLGLESLVPATTMFIQARLEFSSTSLIIEKFGPMPTVFLRETIDAILSTSLSCIA